MRADYLAEFRLDCELDPAHMAGRFAAILIKACQYVGGWNLICAWELGETHQLSVQSRFPSCSFGLFFQHLAQRRQLAPHLCRTGQLSRTQPAHVVGVKANLVQSLPLPSVDESPRTRLSSETSHRLRHATSVTSVKLGAARFCGKGFGCSIRSDQEQKVAVSVLAQNPCTRAIG